jgi:hypothetical protein
MATRKAKAPRHARPCPGKARRPGERPTEPCRPYHPLTWTVDPLGVVTLLRHGKAAA